MSSVESMNVGRAHLSYGTFHPPASSQWPKSSRIVETRHYIEDIQTCITHMQETNEPIYYAVTIRQDYFRVYKQNVSRIGLLEPPLPEYIAMFYTQTQSILEDMADIDDHAKMEKLGQGNLLRRYKNLLSLLQSTVTLSKQILAEISKIYR